MTDTPPEARVQTRAVLRDLRELEPSEVNARQMTAEKMERLVANLRYDGTLTSTPLVYGNRILSGHHRIEAAIKAGITEAICLEIITEVDNEHLTAMQMAHNAIEGEDDPNIIQQMLATLGALMQEYSAVTPPDFDALALAPSIRVPPPIQVHIEFLPEEVEEIQAALKRLEKSRAKLQLEPDHLTDLFLEALFAVKDWAAPNSGAFSNPGTLVLMARLAIERLDQLAIEAREAEDQNSVSSEPGDGLDGPPNVNSGTETPR